MGQTAGKGKIGGLYCENTMAASILHVSGPNKTTCYGTSLAHPSELHCLRHHTDRQFRLPTPGSAEVTMQRPPVSGGGGGTLTS